ncbi:MAG: hypothetical protein WCH86_06905 [Kiritimatiellales bacterium]
MKFKGLLVILVAVSFVALGEINLKVGDPESQIVATLGNPSVAVTKNGSTYYMYDGGDVIAKDGKVIAFPKNYAAVSQRKQAEREAYRTEKLKQEKFAATQKANGLVLYEKQWVTPRQKADLEEEAAAAKEKKAEEKADLEEKEAAAAAKEKKAKKEAKEDAFVQAGLRINDILLSPSKFVGTKITIRGRFRFVHTEQRYFSLEQGDREIDVFYTDVSREEEAEILSQKEYSLAPIEVTGRLVPRTNYYGARHSYYIVVDEFYFPKF